MNQAIDEAELLDRCLRLILAKHDDDFVYELPFEERLTFLVSQGYGGAYSHTGESHYSLDFRMPEGTRVCAARCGTVVTAVDRYAHGGAGRTYMGKDNRSRSFMRTEALPRISIS
jgi:murein DD-endopeptidase MepM/ murein hydrolase activator NlpD